MIIREFAKPVTAKKLNESLAEKFGKRIQLETFTLEQLQDARNRLRTRLSQVETMESFDSVASEPYQKSKLMLDVLNAEISERGGIDEAAITETRAVNEGETEKADIIMSASDMVDRVTGWMEDTAEMQTESMLSLSDSIKAELGMEIAEQYVNTVEPALDQMYAVMEQARTTLGNALAILTGEQAAPTAMGAEEPGMEPEPGFGSDELGMEPEPTEPSFDASAPAAGGEEPLGRARRESVERPLKKK